MIGLRALVGTIAAAAAASLSGCGGPRPAAPPAGAAGAPVTPAALAALAPDTLRIHPLTRVTREPVVPGDGGEPVAGGPWETQLACHIELKDRYGHNTKALGQLRIELYRPGVVDSGGAGGATGETQDLVWDVDLRNPDENALMYDDLVTRTYIVYLGGLPDWVTRWAAGEAREPWITLRASFFTVDCAGEPRRLEGTYRMQR